MSLTEQAGGATPSVPPVRRNFAANSALHPDRLWVRAIRILLGLFVLAALIQKTFDATLPGNDVDIPQLYSEFTVQGNLVLGMVLLASGVRPRSRLPRWWDHVTAEVLAAFLAVSLLVHAAGNARVGLAAGRPAKSSPSS